jgi:hypothetical protein
MKKRISPWWALLVVPFVAAALMLAPRMGEAIRHKLAVNEVFSAYADAMVGKDYKKAYTYTAEDFKKVTDFPRFVALSRQVDDECGGLHARDGKQRR